MTTQNSFMAVKLLRYPDPRDEQEKREQEEHWTKQVQTHHEIQAANHDHTIDFIAAIERGDARYLLFSWPDQDNLQLLREKWGHVSKPYSRIKGV